VPLTSPPGWSDSVHSSSTSPRSFLIAQIYVDILGFTKTSTMEPITPTDEPLSAQEPLQAPLPVAKGPSTLLEEGRGTVRNEHTKKKDDGREEFLGMDKMNLKSDLTCIAGCEGNDAEVTHWCQTCNKHLCSFCVDAHKERTKSHLLTVISVGKGAAMGYEQEVIISSRVEFGTVPMNSSEYHALFSSSLPLSPSRVEPRNTSKETAAAGVCLD